MSGGDWKSMFKAIQEGDYELTAYYLRLGIDPNYQHQEYMASALVESVRYNHLKITKLLLDSGADASIKEVMGGDTATKVAQMKNNQAALNLLNNYLELE